MTPSLRRLRNMIVCAWVCGTSMAVACKRAPVATSTTATVAASTSASASASVATSVVGSGSVSASASDEAPIELPPGGDELIDVDASLGDASSDAPSDKIGDAISDAVSDARKDGGDDPPLLGVATFQEENPVKGIRKITSGAARVHKAPKGGVILTTLPKGTEVSLVAEYLDWYRVRYTDPATEQRRQGWVYVINFAGPRQKSCPVGWTHHDQDGGWCDRECKTNRDCRALPGYKCSGTGCFYAAP